MPPLLAVRCCRGLTGGGSVEVVGEVVRGSGAGEEGGALLLHAGAVALARLEGEGGALPDIPQLGQ